MRWSKLKSVVESRFAPALDGRVAINSAAYGNCSCGHAWLTLDKQVVANFCTRAFWNRADGQFERQNGRWVSGSPIPDHVSESQNRRYGEMEYGELSRQDAYQSCWEFVHDLDIDAALATDDPLIQTLAVLDSRIGKRRLASLSTEHLHPLTKRLLDARLDAEGLLKKTTYTRK